jgi:hypothetical protein
MQVVECLIALTFHSLFVIAGFSSKAFRFLSLIGRELLRIGLLCSYLLVGCSFAKQLFNYLAASAE